MNQNIFIRTICFKKIIFLVCLKNENHINNNRDLLKLSNEEEDIDGGNNEENKLNTKLKAVNNSYIYPINQSTTAHAKTFTQTIRPTLPTFNLNSPFQNI